MPWFKVDDSLHSHRKVKRIPRRNKSRIAAMGLWSLMGSWCADQLTDGHVPSYMPEEEGGSDKEAAELVRVGLWHANGHQCDRCPQPSDPDGWVFHDWTGGTHGWQPSREKVEAEREAAAERQRKAREKAKAAREQREATRDELEAPPPDDGEVTRESRRDGGVSNGAVRSTRPDPTRPDPYFPPSEGSEPTPLTVVCRLISSDAKATTTTMSRDVDRWQRIAGPGVDLEHQAERFLARNGQEGARLDDPPAAWLGWLDLAKNHQPARSSSITAVGECPEHPGHLATNCGGCRADMLAGDRVGVAS